MSVVLGIKREMAVLSFGLMAELLRDSMFVCVGVCLLYWGLKGRCLYCHLVSWLNCLGGGGDWPQCLSLVFGDQQRDGCTVTRSVIADLSGVVDMLLLVLEM